jgi:DNA helicase HerA-like ATPase
LIFFSAQALTRHEEGKVEQDLDTLLAGWLGDASPITILDLSGIPPLIQSELVGSVLRIVYDALFWARNIPEGGRERPLLIVLEEAHAYLDQKQTAAVAVRRIAKEGRKYGIGMMLASQRPAEIDQTILSQCGTLFALRLSNSVDRGVMLEAQQVTTLRASSRCCQSYGQEKPSLLGKQLICRYEH